MIINQFIIAFPHNVEGTSLVVALCADVELHHSKLSYVVKNVRTTSHSSGNVLLKIHIKKYKGRWVHTDSEKETNLSIEAGKAIDSQLADTHS